LLQSIFVKSDEFDTKPHLSGAISKIDIKTPVFKPPRKDGNIYWQKKIEHPGAGYLRLHFTDISVPEHIKIILTIEDVDGSKIEEFREDDLRKCSECWTNVISGDYAFLTIYAEKPPEGLSLSIDKYAYQAYSGAFLSSINGDQKEPIRNYKNSPIIFSAARAVAKLYMIIEEHEEPRSCTGFLINVNTLMTNEHCITEKICKSTVAMFGYEIKVNGRLSAGDQYKCLGVIDSSQTLDYTLLKIENQPGIKWGALEISNNSLLPGQPTILIQHPEGKPKQISKIGCSIVTPSVEGRRLINTDFSHSCDTAEGSSGSPILNDKGKVIGLQRAQIGTGFENTNRGVQISKIQKHRSQ